jgi:hypothetical protein
MGIFEVVKALDIWVTLSYARSLQGSREVQPLALQQEKMEEEIERGLRATIIPVGSCLLGAIKIDGISGSRSKRLAPNRALSKLQYAPEVKGGCRYCQIPRDISVALPLISVARPR